MPIPHESVAQIQRDHFEKARALPIQHSVASVPAVSLDLVSHQPLPSESILHPVKALQDILAAIECVNTSLQLLYQNNLKMQMFTDVYAQIGATVGYTVDYARHGAMLLYVYSTANITLLLSTGGTFAITANVWTNLSPLKGTIITAQGGNDQLLNTLLLRYTNVALG